MSGPARPAGEVSPLFDAELPRLRQAARLGPVVDLACGRGRHTLAAARAGLPAVGVDRSPAFLGELRSVAEAEGRRLETVRTDLETPHGIPFRTGACGAILVFRFLFRPLSLEIERVMAPGALLLYETFTIHQRKLGYGPSNPAFLLDPDELPGLFPGLRVLSHWEGTTPGAKPWAVARLVATRP